jgi:hypothetical protein
MATYQSSTFVVKVTNDAFDATYSPGGKTPFSGIYRCAGCGREVTSVQEHPLPPQNHHQHASTLIPIKWQLIVYCDHKEK